MSTLRADAAPFNPFMFRGPFSSVELNNTPSTTAKESTTPITEQNPPTTNVSPLDLLQFIFTDMDREYLHSMLEARDYDIQNAVQAILKSSDEQDASMFAEEASRSQAYSFVIEEENKVKNSKIAPPPKKEEPAPPPAPVATIPKDAPICKYFLKGCCLIRNCPYKHTTLVACKFFLQGFCMRGDECDYVHTYDSSKANQVMANISNEINQEQSMAQSATSKLSFSNNEFPSLAPPVIKEKVSQKKKKKKKSSTSVTVPNGQISVAPVTAKLQNVSISQPEMTMASKLKLLRMQENFSHVPKDIVSQTYQACQENAEQTELTLAEFYGPSPATPAAKTTPPVAEAKAPIGPPKKSIYSSVPQLWVETGESLAELYEEYRTAAIDHALMRNKFFTLATQGYLAGDGASAREYSRKGRYHQQMMKELHAKASQKIFELRNPGLTVLTNGSTADLHGLHVEEALVILENLLSKVTGQLKYFYIITGTGHHSYEGKSKLLPAIIRFLDEFGCSWVDHSTDKRGGLLKVTLPQ